MADRDPGGASRGALARREQAALLRADLEQFRAEHDLERVVVVYLASSEAFRADAPEWASLAAFERALDAGRAQPASLIYAYAAFATGSPFVNFTPSRASSVPALRELARERGLPHC